MSKAIPVAILGFRPAERTSLLSYFRLAARRVPGYESVLGVDDAQFVIADADEPGVVALLQELGRTRDAVFIGANAPSEAGASLMRPVDPVLAMRRLDALLGQHDKSPTAAAVGWRFTPLEPVAAAPAAPAAVNAARVRALAATADVPKVAQRANAVNQAGHETAGTPGSLRQSHVPAPMAARALLVDDSEIALHFLHRQLAGFGLEVDVAHHSDQAMYMLVDQPYDIVFVDVDLGDKSRVDGFTLCHQIRHQMQLPSGQPPMVVMVSAFQDSVNKVRGTLAGAEGFLGKPLQRPALEKLLERQGLLHSVPTGTALSPQRPPNLSIRPA